MLNETGLNNSCKRDDEKISRVLDYIKLHWDETVHDDSQKQPPPNVAPLPIPHTVPCISGHFPVLFYWDTYFTNIGLIRQKREDLARSNCEAIGWLVDRHGFVPNNTFKNDCNRSQPPYFSLMVREVFNAEADADWLRRIAPLVKREYQFWMNARMSPLGLNRHGQHAHREFLLRFYDGLLIERLKLPQGVSDREKISVASAYLSEAETGWDFNPRFEHRCAEYCPVDLNSNLWRYEKDLAFYAKVLGWGDQEFYEEKAECRAQLMRKYLWQDERGLFMDFDYVNMAPGKTASLAAFHPMWLGLMTKQEAANTSACLDVFEKQFGLAVTEAGPSSGQYQWGYPNGWPPLTYSTVMGLVAYGEEKQAMRISRKYVSWVVSQFEATGQLWEKYNAVTGALGTGEYEAQPMLGWTAGVFVALAEMVLENTI